MTDVHTPTLHDIAADRDWWLRDGGAHYRELAGWLRGIAAKCRLPNPQRELLVLARRYERRAEQFELRTRRGRSMIARKMSPRPKVAPLSADDKRALDEPAIPAPST
jgi:hypothetical protein